MSLRPRLLDTAAENLGRAMPPRLSIDANRFTLIDGSGNEKPINTLTLDVVFIDLNPKTSKLYFGKEYNPNDTGDVPKCWSDNGQAPSSQADQPQSQSCAMCTHNIIGSAISKFTGAKIKACVDMKKLAFVIPGDPSQLIYLMTIKPGSFKNWSAYVNYLKTQKFTNGNQPDLPDVITRLSFESQGVLKYEPSALANAPALLAQIEAAYARNVTDEIVGKLDVPHSGQIAQAPQAQQLPPPPQPSAQAFAPATPTMGQQFAPIHSDFAAGQASQIPAGQASTGARKPRRTRAQIEADNAAKQAPAQPVAPFALPPDLAALPQFPGFTPSQPAPVAANAPQASSAPFMAPAAEQPLEIPPFLRREQPPAMPPVQPSFGLATPGVPDQGLQDAIAKAFTLPTGGGQ